MKRLLIAFLMVAFVFSVIGCKKKSKSQSTPAETGNTANEMIQIGMILPNTIDDKGWSQVIYDAVMDVAKENPGKINVEVSENMNKPVDAGSAARQFLTRKFGYIVFHGTQYNNTVVELAEEFPNTTFIFGTSSEILGPNVVTYQPATEEPGYLAGIIAGMATKTNKIGIVGPVDGGDAAQYNRGYWLGVKSVNPDAEISVAHTGSYADFTKAGELAKAFINDGFDMLAGSAQQGLGALQAVAQFPDQEVYWMGTSEIHFQDPAGSKLLAACTYKYQPIFRAVVEAEAAGRKMGNEVFWLTIPNGGFTFSTADDKPEIITPEILEAVQTATDALKDGSLTIDWQSVEYEN